MMKYLVLVFLTMIAAGCASNTFKVVSTPEKANIFLVDSETGERKSIGVTPYEKVGPEINEVLGDNYQPGRFLNIEIEKEGYNTKKLWVPASSGGSLSTEIKVTLKSAEKEKMELDKAEKIVNQLFLAQKFARMKQFERALIAIDNVLVQHPTFDRALSMKGSIYFAKGEFKESLVWYEKAIDVNPELQGSVEMASKVRKRLNLPQVSRNRKPAGG